MRTSNHYHDAGRRPSHRAKKSHATTDHQHHENTVDSNPSLSPRPAADHTGGERGSDSTGTMSSDNSFACKRAFTTASRVQEDMAAFSSVSFEDAIKSVAKIDHDEIRVGAMLGSGHFCHVKEIVKLDLRLGKSNSSRSNRDPKSYRARRELAAYCSSRHASNDGDSDQYGSNKYHPKKARFALKYIRSNLEPAKLCQGAAEIVLEWHILAGLCHPNIVRLCGVSGDGPAGFVNGRGFFLVLERLYDTLEDRLKRWKAIENKAMTKRDSTYNPRVQFDKRLKAAVELASAMDYLHSKRILYRDLKPSNICFAKDGQLKLVDFGLARELDDAKLSMDGVNYDLSGNKGSLKYQAPEVTRCFPYNLSADVYSFSILFWQMCSLNEPYPLSLRRDTHIDLVCLRNERPALAANWSETLQFLLRSGWHGRPESRPNMAHIHNVLQEEVHGGMIPRNDEQKTLAQAEMQRFAGVQTLWRERVVIEYEKNNRVVENPSQLSKVPTELIWKGNLSKGERLSERKPDGSRPMQAFHDIQASKGGNEPKASEQKQLSIDEERLRSYTTMLEEAKRARDEVQYLRKSRVMVTGQGVESRNPTLNDSVDQFDQIEQKGTSQQSQEMSLETELPQSVDPFGTSRGAFPNRSRSTIPVSDMLARASEIVRDSDTNKKAFPTTAERPSTTAYTPSLASSDRPPRRVAPQITVPRRRSASWGDTEGHGFANAHHHLDLYDDEEEESGALVADPNFVGQLLTRPSPLVNHNQ